MKKTEHVISGQLRVGDDELLSFPIRRVQEKISAAHDGAGMKRILYYPSRNADINDGVFEYCRKLGIQVFLWYKVLAGNSIIPETAELDEDAWGDRGFGESGIWEKILDEDEYYHFGCPRNVKYNNLLFNRCQQMLKSYDGLFVDCIGFPSPSYGIESVFSCFCPHCLAAEPRLREWRTRVRDMRDSIVSASDADLEKWGTLRGVIAEFGLGDFFDFRIKSLNLLANRYADLAKKHGKEIGIDVACPSLADPCGHDYRALGKICDWLKPRIYCRTYGPSSIPLELRCLALGIQTWARRCGVEAVMAFIERSMGIPMPRSLHMLSQTSLPLDTVRKEVARAVALTDAPVYPGIECSFHPEYASGLDEYSVRGHIEAAKHCPGTVLSWNILFIPDAFFSLVGKA